MRKLWREFCERPLRSVYEVLLPPDVAFEGKLAGDFNSHSLIRVATGKLRRYPCETFLGAHRIIIQRTGAARCKFQECGPSLNIDSYQASGCLADQLEFA